MRAQWTQTASVLAMIHNVNCTKKSQLKGSREFDPFAPKEEAIEISVSEFAAMVMATASRR